MIKLTCKICGVDIWAYPSQENRKKYCSKKCFYAGRPFPSEKTKQKMRANSFLKGKPAWNRGMFGKDSVRWKGGRIKNLGGYIEIYKRGHPFCNYKKHVLEHRLIMEKHLGRYFTPEEVVHHRNGIKDDNRLVNLKLFANDIKHRKFHRDHLTKGKI